MSPRVRLLETCRSLTMCSRLIVRPRNQRFRPAAAIFRSFSADTTGQRPPAGPDASEQSEKNISAASNSKTKDAVNGSSEPSTVPELSHVSHDSPIDALDDATLEQILYGGRPATSQQTGGLTAAQEDALYREGTIPSPDEAEVSVGSPERVTANSIQPAQAGDIRNPGLKFDLPKKPYPEGFQMKQRYHPVLEQLTRLLMRDGKLSVAQRNVAMVMNFLRTAPAPIYSPKFPLLPGTPPASHLPLNPVLYITIAIDSVAPLLRVRNIAGAGGGGRALELPVPLAIRQRRREAIKWILDVIEKKPSKGSGRKQFPHRIAEEIIAVVEGRSGVWEKRKQVHKLGTAARANIGSRKLKTKKKM